MKNYDKNLKKVSGQIEQWTSNERRFKILNKQKN